MQMVLRKLDRHMQENKTGPLSNTIQKNQLKMLKDLNVKPEIIKILVENTGNKLLDINLFVFDTNSKGKKSKNKQMGLHQPKKVLHSKGNHQQNENATS